MDWLHAIVSSLADRSGVEADALLPSAEERRALLDVARVASHASGERTNAPLLCYVLGRLAAGGGSLTDAIAIVEEHA
ncbi:MAG TPA: hypothetical protein VGB83_07095 [Actinomycetota bacterium]